MGFGIFRNEPSPDWTNQDVLQAMRGALDCVVTRFRMRYPLIIGGKEYYNTNSFLVFDPAMRSRLIGIVSTTSSKAIEQAGKLAYDAYPQWSSAKNLWSRRELLLKAADIMRQRKFMLAAWEVFEISKPFSEAIEEIHEAIDYIELYARAIDNFIGPVFCQPWATRSEENVITGLPTGTTAAIGPFNFPVALIIEKVAAALAAGSPVLVKPAEQASIVCYYALQCFYDAGIPPEVLAYLPGDAKSGSALVRSPYISRICFTGSQKVGEEIKKEAAISRGFFGSKEVDVELGSNNPMIVSQSADLDLAVGDIMASAMSFCGQKCSSAQRVYLVDDQCGASDRIQLFRARLIDAVNSLISGHPENTEVGMGALIDIAAYSRIENAYGELKNISQSSYISSRYDGDGYFSRPAIFVEPNPKHPRVREELFGPAVFLYFVPTLEDALKRANDADYDILTAGLHSALTSEWLHFKENMNAGNLYCNRPIVGAKVDRQPFGHASKVGTSDRLRFFLKTRTFSRNLAQHGTLVHDPEKK